jgi:predicted RNA-binding protein with PUA-like domain
MANMHWLLKTEPSDYSFEDLVRDGTTRWTGVKNPAAVKHIRSMKKGEAVVIYHTGSEKAAVGLAKVASAPEDDPGEPRSARVDIRAGRALPLPVPLGSLKASPLFARSPLVTMGRLSVVPLTPEQFAFLTAWTGIRATSPASSSPSNSRRRSSSSSSS